MMRALLRGIQLLTDVTTHWIVILDGVEPLWADMLSCEGRGRERKGADRMRYGCEIEG